ncbi:MAG: hypothetical protein ABH851_02310 [Methanobacteriota archaeon]
MINKIKRSRESLLPVEKDRVGECRLCGGCCRLPFKCLFLSKKNTCFIYTIRPPQCRKYPRTRDDKTFCPDCGFTWDP